MSNPDFPAFNIPKGEDSPEPDSNQKPRRAEPERFICWNPESQFPPKKVFMDANQCLGVCRSMAERHGGTFFVCRVVGGANWTPNGVEHVLDELAATAKTGSDEEG